jgi:hypothetical protein
LFLCRCLLLGASCCVVTVRTGFVQANTARYSLLGMFDRNTRKQACIRTYVHQQVLQLELVSSRCLQAVLNTAVCTGFVHMPSQPGTACSICLMGPTHRNRHTSMPDRCATLAVQLHLLAAILVLCWLFLAAQGLCNMLVANTARCYTWCVSDRINTREQACTYIPFVLLL